MSVNVTVPVPVSSRPPTVKETVGRLGIVDHVVGGVIDAERRHLGLVGVERDGIAGGAGVVALSVGEAQRRGDLAVLERMQVDAVGAVAGDATVTLGLTPSEKVTVPVPVSSRPPTVKETAVELGIVDDVVGGVGDHKRRHLGLVGVERDAIAGGVGGVAFGIGEAQRRGDLPSLSECRLTL